MTEHASPQIPADSAGDPSPVAAEPGTGCGDAAAPGHALFARVRVRRIIPWAVAALVGVGIAAALSARSMRGPGSGLNNWLGLALYAALLAWEVTTLERAGISIRTFIRTPSRDEWRLAGLGAALAVVSVGTLFLTMLPISLLAPDLVRGLLRTRDALPVSGHLSAVTALLAVVVAPPIEELLFRGILLQRWAYKWGLPRAAVLSSICFGLLHADPIGKFIFGMVMVWLYVRTDSLIVPIAAHALHNAIFVIPSLLPAPPARPVDTIAMIRSSWPLALASLALGLLIIASVTRGSGRLSTWRLPPVQASTR